MVTKFLLVATLLLSSVTAYADALDNEVKSVVNLSSDQESPRADAQPRNVPRLLLVQARETSTVGQLVVLQATGAAKMRWLQVPDTGNLVDLADGRAFTTLTPETARITYDANKNATYNFDFICIGIHDVENFEVVTHSMRLVGVTPQPGPGPQPPIIVPPGPGPQPPTPPTPPGPVGKIRVLIMEETAERNNLPPSQLTALMSTRVRAYLNTHTHLAGPKGLTPEWRQWDDDFTVDQIKDGENWRKAYEQAKADSKGTLPWIIISDGTRGTSQALPKTEDEVMALLQAYGGN